MHLGGPGRKLDISLMRDPVSLAEISKHAHSLRYKAVVDAGFSLVSRGCLLRLQAVVLIIQILVEVALDVIWL